jgi:GNAT superfamily N-acetyltransferase
VTVRVRTAVQQEHDFLMSVVPRLRAFGPPPLRPPDALDEAEREALARALAAPNDDGVVLVAELAGVPTGVAYAHGATDYFTGERHGHLSIIAVAEEGEGRGVGRALLQAVEEWSTASGHRFITLNVFAGNTRARAVYERAGYGQDTIRYVKALRGPA